MFRSRLKIKEDEIEKIFESKLLRGKKIKLRFFPLNESNSTTKNIWTNLSKIYEKNLRPFEIVEKQVIGFQPNKLNN